MNRFILFLWFVCLVALGVVAHYGQKDIENQRTKGGGSSNPSSIWP